MATITLKEADDAVLTCLPVPQLREIYRSYRRAALHCISAVEVEGQVKAAGATTPVEWVEAIRAVTGTCTKCKGTGVYSWGACLNGKMTHNGPCYRCESKGFVDLDDCRRNYGHDIRAISRAFRGGA